jgi:hypothetical protein
MAPRRRARIPGRTALIIVVAFFDGGAVSIAGVVDQDVDAAKALFGLLYRRGDLVGLGDVKGDGEYLLWSAIGKVGNARGVPCSYDGVVAGADDSICQRAAQSGRAAGDKPGGSRVDHEIVYFHFGRDVNCCVLTQTMVEVLTSTP